MTFWLYQDYHDYRMNSKINMYNFLTPTNNKTKRHLSNTGKNIKKGRAWHATIYSNDKSHRTCLLTTIKSVRATCNKVFICYSVWRHNDWGNMQWPFGQESESEVQVSFFVKEYSMLKWSGNCPIRRVSSNLFVLKG